MSQPLPENPPETGASTQFAPGKSGNPGGRPKGLAKRVRELVGGDGEDLAKIMMVIAYDEKNETTRDRMYAANWLAERGWGKAPAFAPIEDDDPLDLAEREASEIADGFDKRLAQVHDLGVERSKRT